MTSPLAEFLNGLSGGAQQGYSFRTGIEDRKRRIASEDDAAQYEKARRLREDVAFGLQQRVGESNLETAAAQRANLTADNERQDRAASLSTYQTMFPTQKPLVQDWQKEGFKTQQAWQDYHKDISRAGEGSNTTSRAGKDAIGYAMTVSAVQKARQLVEGDPTRGIPAGGADVLSVPDVSPLTQMAAGLPVIGRMFKPAADIAQRRALSPARQQYHDAVNAVAHSIIGKLGSGSRSITLFNSLKETIDPVAGDAPETQMVKYRRLLRLGDFVQTLGPEPTPEDVEALIAQLQNDPGEGGPPASIQRPAVAAPSAGTAGGAPKKRGDPSKFFNAGQSP